MIRRYLLIILAASMLTTVVAAQPAPAPTASSDMAVVGPAIDPQNLATARELVRLMDFGSMLNNMFGVLQKTIMPIVLRNNPNQNTQVQKLLMDTFQSISLQHLPQINENNAIIYARIFTHSELQQLIAIYKSPVQQKMQAHAADIMQQSAAMNTPILHQAMQETIQTLAVALRKNGMVVPKEIGAPQ